MKLNDSRLPFLDILITKSGKKVWINIYSNPTDSKRYVSHFSNHPKPFTEYTTLSSMTHLYDSRKHVSKCNGIYGNLETLKTLSKIFVKHKLIDCKRQSSNLKRLLCFRLSTNKPTFKKTKCGKSCFC